MEASTQVPQIEKKLYKNNTAGWLGVVTLDHKGEELGVSIEPLGTIWLSDAEAILTARAPKDPKDNPFEEQEFVGVDANGTKKPYRFRPLTLASDDSRMVSAIDRYVPGQSDAEAKALSELAAKSDEPGSVSPQAAAVAEEIAASAPVPDASPAAVETPSASPPSTEAATAEEAPPPSPDVEPSEPGPPLAGQDVDTSATDEPESWTEPSPQAGQVVTGSLAGADGPAPDASAETPAPAAGAAAIPAQAVPTGPGGQPDATEPQGQPPAPADAPASGPEPAEEETAAAVDPAVGEETGAAPPPAGDAPEGEYAQAEEVGSPDAPSQGDASG